MIIKTLITITIIYRLIPSRIRRTWSFGCSTSGTVLTGLRSGEIKGWRAAHMFLRCAIPAFKIRNGAQISGWLIPEPAVFNSFRIDARWSLWPQLPGQD